MYVRLCLLSLMKYLTSVEQDGTIHMRIILVLIIVERVGI